MGLREDRAIETAALLNEMVPPLMEELAHRGFDVSDQMDPSSVTDIPERSVIEMVAELITELPQAQVIDLALNAVVQLAMVHIKYNEAIGGV